MKKQFNQLTNHHLTKNSKGIALISALIIITLVSILLTSYVAVTISEKNRIKHQTNAASAEYIARAGLEWAFLDLSCEYNKDGDWTDDNTINNRVINASNYDFVVDPGEGMLDATDIVSFSNDDDKDGDNLPPETQSNYVPFYLATPFSDGEYAVDIAFIATDPDNCPGPGCTFKNGRLLVRSTGTVTQTADSVTLIQLARGKPIKNMDIDGGAGRLYDVLDALPPLESAVDTAEPNNRIRIAGARIDGDVLIDNLLAGETLRIQGGYGYSFTDGSRDTTANQSILEDTVGGNEVIRISGSGKVIMGGVRIE